ncbi:hypothetical protein [Dehalogenimonas sp. 4OHTPN]|uniref:Asp23/Gls24 family envelope stress response protein n=1 Tax=Dehalogenimonas sp. 4OHTPN TaxID=3166643 RepID=A0AAU8G958_9CHLR
MGSKTVTLKVNGTDVTLSFFVQTYFDRVLDGMATALESTCKVETMILNAKDNRVALVINGASVRLNEFVECIIFNTVQGMVSSLRGVTHIENFVIAIGPEK